MQFSHDPTLRAEMSSPDFRSHKNSFPATPPPPPALAANNANALSVGIMAQGFAWVRRQRETRKRMYLQNQAEQQLRKIQEAELAAEAAASNNGRSLVDNPTFQTMSSARYTKSSAQNNERQSTADHATSSSKAHQTTTGTDTAPERSARISKSGDGYSVALPDHYKTLDSPSENPELDAEFVPPVRVVEDDEDLTSNPFLLDPSQMHQIAKEVLPRGIAYCRWTRIYCLTRDGDAFDECLRRLSQNQRTLLVVRTSRNEIFGGFADAPWSSHKAEYYGGSSACLFKVDPATQQIRHYPWSGANRYVQLCDTTNKMMALGGGGGAFGLCLQDDFQRGSTGSCATFANEPLCSQENFDIVDMEVFGFLVGQF